MSSTRELIEEEIAVARISARRATRAVLIFGLWLAITWIGPELAPPAGWSIWISIGTLAGYSLLTVVALIAVYRGAMRAVRTGVMRRVVSEYLAPFWIVAGGSVCVGGVVWTLPEDPLVAAWLGVGAVLTCMSTCYALARVLEIRSLRKSLRQIEVAEDLSMPTWTAELRKRIDTSSVRPPR